MQVPKIHLWFPSGSSNVQISIFPQTLESPKLSAFSFTTDFIRTPSDLLNHNSRVVHSPTDSGIWRPLGVHAGSIQHVRDCRNFLRTTSRNLGRSMVSRGSHRVHSKPSRYVWRYSHPLLIASGTRKPYPTARTALHVFRTPSWHTCTTFRCLSAVLARRPYSLCT